MAYGQIDPARLHGEALRRWYERSPAELEAARETSAAKRHAKFFDQLPHEEPDERSASPTGRSQARVDGPSPASLNMYQPAAASPSPGFWDYWSFRGCRSCHGYTPKTLPPVGGHSPFRRDNSVHRGDAGRPRPRRSLGTTASLRTATGFRHPDLRPAAYPARDQSSPATHGMMFLPTSRENEKFLTSAPVASSPNSRAD